MAITKVTLEWNGEWSKSYDIDHATRILTSGNNKGFKLKDEKFQFDGSKITRRKRDKGEGGEPKV
jgi:hypothetical protein